jgi:putative membrane protein
MVMTDLDHARVSDAVHGAEQGTAGEIVTIIADRSDRYLDIALWWSIGAVIAALAGLAAFSTQVLGFIASFTGGWSSEWALAEAFELSLAVAILTFAVVRLALAWIPLRMFLTPGTVKHRRVRRRAVRYFKVGAERRTAGRTGILIYLSMAEHRAEIVADEAIHGLVAPEAWGEAMADLIDGVKAGRVADGMVAAIGDVGVILSAHFPRADGDVNELPDRLIEL